MSSNSQKQTVRARKSVSGKRAGPPLAKQRSTQSSKKDTSRQLSSATKKAGTAPKVGTKRGRESATGVNNKKQKVTQPTADTCCSEEELSSDGSDDGADLVGFICDDDETDLSAEQYQREMAEIKGMFRSRLGSKQK